MMRIEGEIQICLEIKHLNILCVALDGHRYYFLETAWNMKVDSVAGANWSKI